MTTKTWRVDIFISEKEGRTHAEAALLSEGVTANLVGEGNARRNPRDREVPEIGDELATARALSDLAHKLLEATAEDIEAITHEQAQLTS